MNGQIIYSNIIPNEKCSDVLFIMNMLT